MFTLSLRFDLNLKVRSRGGKRKETRSSVFPPLSLFFSFLSLARTVETTADAFDHSPVEEILVGASVVVMNFLVR